MKEAKEIKEGIKNKKSRLEEIRNEYSDNQDRDQEKEQEELKPK